MRRHFGYGEQPNFPPRYNVAPTQPVPIVVSGREGPRDRHFMLARWGFLPGFAKDPKEFPLIVNARAETLTEKPSYRAAVRRRRCLFVADGWYEWRRERGYAGKMVKRPFLFRAVDGAPLALAGLWETWMDASGSEIDTACIVTTLANGALAAVHERAPALIAPEDFDIWLDHAGEDPARALKLLRPAPDDAIGFVEVSSAVNSYQNDGPEIQTPVSLL